MSRSGLAIAGVVACAAIAFVFACGDDYSEAGNQPASDAGTEAAPDVEQRDANAIVQCKPSGCTPTCCLSADPTKDPACCGENTAGWDIILKCASSANCASNQVCCIHKGTSVTTAECAVPNDCPAPAGRMCDGNALKSGCNPGASCSESLANMNFALPKGYAVCTSVGD